jgi:hypothetical protein
MDKNNLIIWQKWLDPFGSDDTEVDEFDPYTGDYIDSDEDLDKNEEENNYEEIIKKKNTAVRVIATPMGIIPMNENTASGKLFNFWMGHTNFDISKKIALMIEKTDGVETLDIFTRYRFRVSIGKAFDDSETMRNINKTIYSELNNG